MSYGILFSIEFFIEKHSSLIKPLFTKLSTSLALLIFGKYFKKEKEWYSSIFSTAEWGNSHIIIDNV